MASAVYNIVDDDPETGFFSGAEEGWSGDVERSWGDVVGIPPTKPTDTWSEYLAKGIPRLGLDIILDPLNLLFGAGAITKGLGLSADGVSAVGRLANVAGAPKAMEALAGSGFGKAFMHGWHGVPESIQDDLLRIQREGSMADVQDLMEGINSQLATRLKELDVPETEMANYYRQIFEELERPGTTSIPHDIAEMFQPAKDLDLEKYNQLGRLRQQYDIRHTEPIVEEGYEYMPRYLSALGQYKKRGTFQMDPKNLRQESREIFRWVDPDTGKPVHIGKTVDKGGIIKPTPDPETFLYHGLPVKRKQASLQEVARVAGERDFIDNPVEALRRSLTKKQGQINYLRMTETLENGGLLKSLDEFPYEEITPGWRKVKAPGFENHIAPKAVANKLENVSNALYDPDKFTGKLEEFLSSMWNTKIGQVMRQYTQHWKRGVLALHPGFHVANAVSNVSLAAMGGVNNPARFYEAGRIMTGTGDDVVEGLTNAQLKSAFRQRNLIQGDTIAQVGEVGLKEGDYIPFGEMVGERVGKATQKTMTLAGNRIRALNDMGFKLGRHVEDHARLAVAVDWLKKHTKGRVVTQRDLDRAAQFAKDTLFDYGDLTTFERSLRNFFPFYTWHRAIIGKTLRDLGVQPHRMAHLGRFYDFALRPVDEMQREVMPEWMQVAPIQGIGAHQFEPSEEGLPSIALAQRFLPHGTVQEWINRPVGDQLMSLLTPVLKGPYEAATNWSSFLQHPIDPLAETPGQAFTAPITGGEYGLARDRLFGISPPAAYDYALKNWSPIGRHLNTANEMARGWLFEDPNRPAMDTSDKLIWYLSGGKKFPFDEGRAKYWRDLERRRGLTAIKKDMNRALKKGDLRRYEHAQEMYQRRLLEDPYSQVEP